MKQTTLNRIPRYEKIGKKLGFALTQHRALQGELLKRSATELGSHYIEETLEVILGACRECLDYCARDIAEQLLSSPVKEPKFPFSRHALETQRLGRTMAKEHPALHAHFARLVAAVENDEMLQGTLFSMGTLQWINDLVNDKKHNITVIVDDRPDTATLISHAGTRLLMRGPVAVDEDKFDYGAPSEPPEMVAVHGSPTVTRVPQAYITSIDREVGSFCLSALGVTWRALDGLYSAFFGKAHGALDPWESTKPPEQREYEASLRRLSPITHRLSAVALRSGESTTLLIRFDRHERPETTDASEIALAAELLQVFRGHLVSTFSRQIESTMRQRLAAIERQGATPRSAEFTVQTGEKILEVGHREVSYDNVLFGVTTWFRSTKHEPTRTTGTAVLLDRLLGIRSDHVMVRSAEPLANGDQKPPRAL